MIKLARMRTGQFVLIHQHTGTVIVAETLEDAYTQLTAQIGTGAETDNIELTGLAGADPAHRSASRARMMVVVGMVLLPFLWLAILHYSLGALVDEGIHQAKGLFEAKDTAGRLAEQMDQLKTAQSALDQQFADLKGKGTAAPSDLKQYRTELDSLKQQQATISSRIDSLATQLGTALKDVTALRQAGDTLKTRVDAIPGAPPAAPPPAPGK